MVATVLIDLFYGYLLTGFLFGLWFVFHGVHRVDAGMKNAGWLLRLMLLPGSMALWPVMLRKFFKSPS